MTTLDNARDAVGPAAFSLEILDVHRPTADAVSISFTSPESSDSELSYQPGQFLTLEIPSDRTGSVSRCYSLSSAPSWDRFPTVTVKRTADGYASNWLCDNAKTGMIIRSLAPAGTFVPRAWDRDFVLCAAGSGITPILSIVKTALADHSNSVTLIYANRDTESVIFAGELVSLAQRFPDRLTVHHWLESSSGLPTAEDLSAFVTAVDSEAYLCGPAPFMEIAEHGLLLAGMAGERIHREVFRSLTLNPFDATLRTKAPQAVAGGSRTVTASVELEGETHSIEWPEDTVLLDVLLDKGIDAPYVCREGSCGGCAYKLTTGEVKMLVNDTLDSYELKRGVRLACQSIPISDTIEACFE